MKKVIFLAIAGCLGFSGIASADLVKSDFVSQGDNLVVTDTTTGIKWLSLLDTLNMSVNDVRNQMGTGGRYEGWILADHASVQHLAQTYLSDAYANLPVSSTTPGGHHDQEAKIYSGRFDSNPEANAFAEAFGDVNANNGYHYMYGMHEDGVAGSEQNYVLGVHDSGAYGGQTKVLINHLNYSYSNDSGGAPIYTDDYNGGVYGVYLIEEESYAQYSASQSASAEDVSVPALLGGVSLLLLWGGTIRPKKTKTGAYK